MGKPSLRKLPSGACYIYIGNQEMFILLLPRFKATEVQNSKRLWGLCLVSESPKKKIKTETALDGGKNTA